MVIETSPYSLTVQIDDHHGGGLAVHSAVAIAVAAWFPV
jgi:hypothetical protein